MQGVPLLQDKICQYQFHLPVRNKLIISGGQGKYKLSVAADLRQRNPAYRVQLLTAFLEIHSVPSFYNKLAHHGLLSQCGFAKNQSVFCNRNHIFDIVGGKNAL